MFTKLTLTNQFLIRFERVFTATAQAQYNTNPIIYHHPQPRPSQPAPQNQSWSNSFLRFFQSSSNDEVDIEAQVCRPHQHHVLRPIPSQPQAQAGVGATSTIFIERNQFMINGTIFI